jgi:hypothetical protein
LSDPSERTPRELLWIALSDLFLDTETRWFLPHVAGLAVRHGFSWSQVQSILEDELTPVLGDNLTDVAGEWAAFDPEWLLKSLHGAGSWPRLVTRALLGPGQPGLATPLLEALAELMAYLSEAIPPHLQTEEVRRLDHLARLALEQEWTAQVSFWSHARGLSLHSAAARVGMSFWQAVRPIYGALLVYSDDPTVAQLEANWGRLHGLLLWLEQQPEPRETLLRALEELSYLFTVDGLAGLPRGPMMRGALAQLGWEQSRLEALWRGPLSRLYGCSERPENNWRELFL